MKGDLDAELRRVMSETGLPRYVAALLVGGAAARPPDNGSPDHCGLCGRPTDGTWDCTSCALDEDAQYID